MTYSIHRLTTPSDHITDAAEGINPSDAWLRYWDGHNGDLLRRPGLYSVTGTGMGGSAAFRVLPPSTPTYEAVTA